MRILAQLARHVSMLALMCVSIAIASEALLAAPLTPQAPSYVYKTVGARTLTVDMNYPPDWKVTDHRPAIVFFSGGGFRNGNTQQFTTQADYFAKRGMVAIRAEYRDRTRDMVTAKTCLQDAFSAMRWVRQHAAELGVDPNRIVASGGSAGGFLASSVAATQGLAAPGDDQSISPVPNALVLFNPVVDVTGSASMVGESKELLSQISPAHHLTASYPPTVILIGSEDSFLPQVEKFVADAKQLGVKVEIEISPDQPHAFFNRDPWTGKTAARADQFLQSIGYLKADPVVDLPKARKQPAGEKKQERAKGKKKAQ